MLTASVVGDVCERIESSFDWRIRNWKSCKKEQLHLWQSPSFQFSSAIWKLKMCFFADGQIWFSVTRMKDVQNRQVVEFKLIARKSDETEYKITEDKFEFTEKFNESHTLFKRGNLLTNETTDDDNITVSCTLSGNRSTANKATQSMSSKSEEGCTKESETRDAEDQVKPAKRGTKDFEKLSQNFKDLLLSGQGSDVTVKVDGREFLAHKVILGARSSVFKKMFSHDMEEKKGGVVDIRDCTPDAFKEFLFYLYSGELDEFSRNTVFDLYLLSDKYDVQGLKSASVNFIAEDLCMDNFCDAVHLALQHSESVLLQKATKFFEKNLKKIIVSAKWQSFITENPIQANELYIKALKDLLPE